MAADGRSANVSEYFQLTKLLNYVIVDVRWQQMFRQTGTDSPKNLRSKIRNLFPHKHHLQVRETLHWHLSNWTRQLPTSGVSCLRHEGNRFQQQELLECFPHLLWLGSIQGISNLRSQPNWIQVWRWLRREWLRFSIYHRLYGCQLQARHDQGGC